VHGLLGLAGLLALVTLAFGHGAAVWLARLLIVVPLLLVVGVLVLKWMITVDLVRLS
jgi:hypothetical protein